MITPTSTPIFHATQALLGLKKVKIANRMHYATMIVFAKHFIISNELAEELFFYLTKMLKTRQKSGWRYLKKKRRKEGYSTTTSSQKTTLSQHKNL
jgi:uncharacterized protein (UPF0332 family)